MAAKKKPIKIKPSQVGSLRKATGTPEGKNIPASKLQAAKNSKDPAMHKKANFAINAKKWGK